MKDSPKSFQATDMHVIQLINAARLDNSISANAKIEEFFKQIQQDEQGKSLYKRYEEISLKFIKKFNLTSKKVTIQEKQEINSEYRKLWFSSVCLINAHPSFEAIERLITNLELSI